MKRRLSFAALLLFAVIGLVLCCMPSYIMVVWLSGDNGGASSGTVFISLWAHVLLMLSGGAATSIAALALALCFYRFASVRMRKRLHTVLYCLGGVSPVCYVALCHIVWGQAQSFLTLLLAVVMAALPFSCRYILEALEQEAPILYDSARALGMSGGAAMFFVLIPGARRGIIGTFLHTCCRVGAMAAIINILGRRLYLTGILTLSPAGELLAVLLLAILCVGFYVMGNVVLRRRSYA